MSIEGLTALDSGERRAVISGGQFSLPITFDSKQFSAKWVEEGPNVQEAQQEEMLIFAGMKAQGWKVHKAAKISEDKKEKPTLEPYKRAVGKRVFVLMERPKALQQAVNKIYANQSRSMVNAEVNGETKAVSDDPGILTNADIRKFDRQFQDAENAGGYLKPNPDVISPEDATTLHLG